MKTWTNTMGSEARTKAGTGEWSSEPDKGQWIDESTDLDCLIVRNRMGALCGYVGVQPGHPWHGKDYSDIDADVHGGLTFASACAETEDPAEHICHVLEPGRPEDIWWIGFDCAHAHDIVPTMAADGFGGYLASDYRDWNYVTRECARLAEQVKAAA